MNTWPLANIALSDLTYGGISVPVAQINYTGTVKTYIRFYNYLDHDEFYADDEPQSGGTNDTVDIFSDKRGALTELLPQIKQRLRNANFVIGDIGPQQYEDDTKMYHLPINIYHESEV